MKKEVLEEKKKEEKNPQVAEKDKDSIMNDINQTEFDPETLEVEKLLSSDDEEEAVEVPDYESEIIKIVKSNSSPKVIKNKLDDYHDNNIAHVLAELKKFERQKLYRILDEERLASIFEYVYVEDASAYVNEMDLKKASGLVSKLEPDTAVEILKELDKSKRTLLIDSMESQVRKDIKMIASFDEDEIGSRMTTNYIIIKDDIDVKKAMTELVSQAKENDNIQTIFVEDEDRDFVGAIDLKKLITAGKEDKLSDLIVTSFPYVYGTESIDECIERLKDYNESLIPVLDNSNRILGVITSQNLIEVVDEEMGEDYAKFAGLIAEEDIKEPIVDSMKKRLPWLLILLFLGVFVSTVVGIFESVISQLTIIMAFQSLILDMSGNVGTQSLAVTIRVLLDENLTGAQKLKLVFKEVRIGFIDGIILAGISFLLVGLYIMYIKDKTLQFSFSVSGCIAVSMIVAMIISSMLGTLIPMFFKKLKIDPAVASGPLITTLNDLIAVVTYYGMSWILLINVMQLSN